MPLIGAIFIDGGYQAAAEFVERAWSDRLRKPMRALRDPKTVLQEWAQGHGMPAPSYHEVSRSGPDHDPEFRVAVQISDLEPTEGVGVDHMPKALREGPVLSCRADSSGPRG